MTEFAHLHVHTEYSLLDGLCRIPDLLDRTKALGMSNIALTDHGGMYGAIEFYSAAKERGIRPIIGMEGYVAPGDHRSKTTADKNPFHLVLLAKNMTGYRNLIALNSKAHLDGFYYKPRMDRDLLAKHSEGLICLSACPSGEVLKPLIDGRPEDSRAAARWYKEVFGEDYFIEVQRHDMPQFAQAYKDVVDVARELDIPIVGTNDLHYVRKEDSYAQDVLICIQTNAQFTDDKRMKMESETFYLRTPEEMGILFDGLPEAMRNTLVIAERCDLKFDFDRVQLPEVPLPPGMNSDNYLEHLCRTRLPERYGGSLPPAVKERLDMELDVVKVTGFANYLLVVEDIASFTRRAGIAFGVRGSAAASILLYALRITDIDPLERGLVFERFLNIERKEMPDIDMDFQDDRREEVINYVVDKYGRDRVAQIITFGTLGAKAALRDVGRCFGMPYGVVDRVAKLVPQQLHMTMDRAIAESPDLKRLIDEDAQVKKLVETVKQLEGITRHSSTHAAGVVIARDPLIETVPLQRPTKGDENSISMTQFDMNAVAKIGLLKMDFLGLINLQVLARARALIARTRGVDLDLLNLPRDDEKSFKLLGDGDTGNVFQLESGGMRRYIKELRPNSIEEITAMIALYRPGPMAQIPKYIDSKHGRQAITYPNPDLEPILKETYGVIVYQDQVLFIVRKIAGFSLGKADIFRKAMGKKIASVMQSMRKEFLDGAAANGYSEADAIKIFDLIEPFAGYAFNKAHSACYAEIAYQTAYLKANYPSEYLAAVLSAQLNNSERVAMTIAESKRLGIEVLGPDINESGVEFTVDDRGGIRFGLGAIKNVGHGAAESLVATRNEGGPFLSIDDFCRRLDTKTANKRVIESLGKAGAFDQLGERGSIVQSVDRLIAHAQRQQKMKETGQATMFDLFGAEVPVPQPEMDLPTVTVSTKERLAWEKDMLGVYLSEHPFTRVAADRDLNAEFCGSIGLEHVGQAPLVAGMVQSVRTLFTKDRRAFCSAILEDLTGTVEVTVWSDVYDRTKDLWSEGTIVLVRGKVKPRDDHVQIVADDVMEYEAGSMSSMEAVEASVRRGTRVLVTFQQDGSASGDTERFDQLVDLLRQNDGEDPVQVVLTNGAARVRVELPKVFGVTYTDDLRTRIDRLVGTGATETEYFELAMPEEAATGRRTAKVS